MFTHKTHSFIPEFPQVGAFQNARLNDLHQEKIDGRKDLVLDIHSLVPLWDEPLLTLLDDDGHPAERVRGHYVPRRFRFRNLLWCNQKGLYNTLDTIPSFHEIRSIRGLLHWIPVDGEPYYLLAHGGYRQAGLIFSAEECVEETIIGDKEAVDYIRRWSPSPPLPPGWVPDPKEVRHKYGGDPVEIHLDGKKHKQLLFVGSMEEQHDRRPQVDAVLNLGERKSNWVPDSARTTSKSDRWVEKGEGAAGMSVEEITTEAEWVIQKLKRNERVLVHCVAGFNRSVTICTAIVILLEGLSAEDAFDRVRAHHPWARPDTHHWMQLKWMAR